MQRTARMKKELVLLTTQPPFGVSCWAEDENFNDLQATILGTEGSPYENGLFKLAIQIPDRYPFEPPKVRFTTPIYHPNIDNEGRICLDVLQMPPKGRWKPSLNIYTLLTSIQLLMNEPNTDDPLMGDISEEYKYCRAVFDQNARDFTSKYALQNTEVTANKDFIQY